jgi:hypothetical protein
MRPNSPVTHLPNADLIAQLTTNLLSIPNEAISCVTLFLITWLSVRIKERAFVSMLQNIWLLPCLLALRLWKGANEDAWGTFGLITTLLSYPYCHAIVVSWASRNSGSVRTRSVSAAFYNMSEYQVYNSCLINREDLTSCSYI